MPASNINAPIITQLILVLLTVIVSARFLELELSRPKSILSKLTRLLVVLASTVFPIATLVFIPLSASNGFGNSDKTDNGLNAAQDDKRRANINMLTLFITTP
jgi:hypothetical protein